MLQGYTLTGRTGLFSSYEAFLGIIHTMMVSQYLLQVFKNRRRNVVASRHRLAQLYRDIDLDSSGAQWILPSKSFIYWRCA